MFICKYLEHRREEKRLKGQQKWILGRADFSLTNISHYKQIKGRGRQNYKKEETHQGHKKKCSKGEKGKESVYTLLR